MSFVNTLPYISNPIEEFKTYHSVNWDRDIYPAYKGRIRTTELEFFVNMITKGSLTNILDLGLGGGQEVSGIAELLEKQKYPSCICQRKIL